MKKVKKVLSFLLVFCMILTIMPMGVYATDLEESSAAADDLISEATPTPVPAEDIPADDPVEEDPTPAPTEQPTPAPAEEPAEYGVMATSITMGTKPADGTTSGNPFVQGTGGSNSFRIPAMVTLNDGTIVAAADARWNTTYDGGGLDTIVSYSTDNGANWNYTFANYLGDNGNTYNGSSSTAFIDPALATDGSTVYMLCDLYPYGVALNGSGNTAPSTAVGFNSDGTLKLAANGSSTYNYYLKDGQIYDSSNNVVSGYTVDAYFNITGNGYDTNLFFSDSPYQVVRTGYLYLTKSTDGGKTWSEPTLIPNVKMSSEQVCLVGPGRGLVADGKIIFPVYSYNGSSSQQMGFIYSIDGGATWSRSANFTGASWSSEAAVVELNDGTLRFFYRNGNSKLYYVDYTRGTGWGSAVNTGIATNSNTQISAISYSKTVDGKQVILVSCPTGSNSNGSADSSASARLNGKIFVGYVNSDNTMSWQSDKAISVTSNNSQFMYSCLTELNDGKVAILYENQESAWGTGNNCYYTMDFKTYDLALDITIVDRDTGIEISAPGLTDVSITECDTSTPAAGYSKSVTYSIVLNNGNYTDSAEIKIPYDNTFDGCTNYIGAVANTDGTVDTFPVELVDGYFVGTVPHFSDVTISGRTLTEKDVNLQVGESKKITDDTGNYESSYTGEGLNTSIATVTVQGFDGEPSTIQKWQLVTNGVSGINTIDKYLIVSANSGNAYALTSSGGTTPVTISDGIISVESVAASSNAVFTFESSGNSWAIKGTTGYLYPTATRSWRSWSYSLSSGNRTSQTVTISGSSGVNVSRGVTLVLNSTTSYLTLDSAAGASQNSDTVYLFKLVENTTTTNPGTTIIFTGVSAGTTTAVVGSTQYNITVTRKTETVNLSVGGSATYTDASSNVTVQDSTVASATLSGGKLTIKGLKDGTTTITTDTTVYTVTVSEGTPISIRENKTTTISVPPLSDGQYVEWSSADSSYVGVAGKYDASAKAYTNEAILAGQNVTSSPVVVTGTVYNADGTVAGVYKWLVTVTEGDADTNTSSKGIYFNISTIEHCTVYYSINGGELIPVNGTGVTTGNWTGNGTYKGHFNIMFFAAPDEGYALTYMSISGSADQYYTLANGNPDGTGSDAWPFKDADASTIPSSSSDSAWKTINGSLHGFRWALLEGNMTIDQMKVLFSNAIALGCDGATTITKNGNEGMGSASSPTVCKFVAQKLPTVEKTITSITHNGTETAYTDGMKVEIGDTIKYSVVVTRYKTNATYGTITYDNEKLTDELTSNNGISNPDMGTSTTSNETYTYTTSLTLTTNNFSDVVKDGKIINTAEFSYSYSSQYSAGSLTSEASAVAEITVEIPSYVIDFGLPVELDLTNVATAYGGITKASAKYGNASINDNVVTYTPTETLKGVDYITLELGKGGTTQVAIYPATTVYYEEGFATYEGGWTGGSKGNGTQTASVVGSKALYGYDSQYANETVGKSNGTEATCGGRSTGQTATFEFTGTGVEIYTNNTDSSGSVMASIYNATTNAHVKTYIVHTAMKDGDSDATHGQNVTAYNVPIISARDLAYGQYKVVIKHVKSSASDTTIAPVSLDGFRVHGTLNTADSDSVYAQDGEANPTFVELRDAVLIKGLQATPDNSKKYADQIAADTMSQVMATGVNANAIVFTTIPTDGNSGNLTDLIDNGPKNEIYLKAGQTLAFSVTGGTAQVGIKALNGQVSYEFNSTSGTLTTSTDMFYEISSGVCTIKNAGSDDAILSVTLLKLLNDAKVAALSEETMTFALRTMGYSLSTETEEPAATPEPTIEPTATPEPTAEPKPVVTPTPAPTNPPKPVVPNNPIQDFFNAVRNILNKWFGW